jgi:hypothetical protein
MGKSERYGPLLLRTLIIGKFLLVLTLEFNLYIVSRVCIRQWCIITRQATYVYRNIEVRSRYHCFSEKSKKIITLSSPPLLFIKSISYIIIRSIQLHKCSDIHLFFI